MDRIENQTLALAGMFQSAALIEQLASSGELNSAAFDCSFDSLFTFDAASPTDVFGDIAGLNRGLKIATQYLGGENKQTSKNIAYYVISMLKLSTVLLRSNSLAETIQHTLQKIKTQSQDFEQNRNTVINKIDGLYQDTISSISPRIIVQGDQNFLTNTDNASKIRTLLLAGIRSAVLWNQLGGSKWKLLFSRKKYLRAAQSLLAL